LKFDDEDALSPFSAGAPSKGCLEQSFVSIDSAKEKRVTISGNPLISLRILVAWGGIEPPTQGFSILCSTD
jgi:hypothetical protein